MPAALLSVDGLVPRPAAETDPAWTHSVSFTIQPGESLAVLGPRRAGKSALLRAAALVRPPAAGRVLFAGVDLTRLRPADLRPLRRRFPFVGGDPARAFPPRVTVAQALREPLEIHRLGTPAERLERARASLAEFGLNPGLFDRPVRGLSAGLRQAVALARALALQPELLAADEVVDHLEPAAAAPLLDRLRTLGRARGLAWVWTTSAAELAARYADRVLRLEDGQLRE